MNDNLHLVLFECCRVVKGYHHSLIYDLQRNLHRFLPNDLADILLKYNKYQVSQIKQVYENKYDEILDENISLLVSEEYVFLTDSPDLFPKMNLDWDEPCEILNSVIVAEEYLEIIDLKNLWNQYENLGCRYIEMRSFNYLNLINLENIVSSVSETSSLIFDIILKNYNYLDADLLKLYNSFSCINSITIHSDDEDKVVLSSKKNNSTSISRTKKIIRSNDCCGVINKDYFVSNVKMFTESQIYNSCLNRKISLDEIGNIKQCPSLKNCFGNIANTTLREALEKIEFKKYWNINKDQILVCKDCEYRYMCHDCRAFIEDPLDIFSKPSKCGYNPYTGEWKN